MSAMLTLKTVPPDVILRAPRLSVTMECRPEPLRRKGRVGMDLKSRTDVIFIQMDDAPLSCECVRDSGR